MSLIMPADNHVTQFQYDGGTLGVGNLTKTTEAAGSSIQQATNLFYDAPDGSWGLPTRVDNEVGAETRFGYDPTTGQLLTATSPVNLVGTDQAASVTTLAYNGDGLPNLVQDPMGHQVQVGYAPSSLNVANLVVTTTFNDGSTRQVTLDPKGRTLNAVDERGILTAWTYNPQEQVKTITRDAGEPSNQRVTTLSYDGQGNLRWFDPPIGSSGRVQFEYVRYNSDGTLQGTYEGRVTHIVYPDGRNEYFGYNNAGELAWKRKGSGGVINIEKNREKLSQ